jgi:hypothetical protein
MLVRIDCARKARGEARESLLNALRADDLRE